MQSIQPIVGWVLNHVAELDRHHPGAAGAYLRASDERRQVIAALLAMAPHPSTAADADKLAKFIDQADHKTILLRAFGAVPVGLRGALSRCGHQPYQPSFYRLLFQILKSSGTVAQVVRRLSFIDYNRLRIAKHLPEDVCTANLVALLSTPEMARDVATMVTLLEANGINRCALSKALAGVQTPDQLSKLWERWASKCQFPNQPIAHSAEYRPVRDGDELRSIAERFRNCSRRYLHKALRGEAAFAEFRHQDGAAVIHLGKGADGWVLEGLFGPANRPLSPPLRDAALLYLKQHGITDRLSGSGKSNDWSVLRRLTGGSMLEIGWD